MMPHLHPVLIPGGYFKPQNAFRFVCPDCEMFGTLELETSSSDEIKATLCCRICGHRVELRGTRIMYDEAKRLIYNNMKFKPKEIESSAILGEDK